MNQFARTVLMGALGTMVLALAISPVHAFPPNDPGEVILNSQKMQIIHSGKAEPSDTANINLNITNLGEGDCDFGEDDFLATGIEIGLEQLDCNDWNFFCGELGDGFCVGYAFDYTIPSFIPHTIGHTHYGTYTNTSLFPFVTSKIQLLSVPYNGCGTWSINFEAKGVDLSSISSSSKSNPIALIINDRDNSGPFCFDVTNALVGNPPGFQPTQCVFSSTTGNIVCTK